MKRKTMELAVLLAAALAAGSGWAYTFGESRSAASTEIFGYDQAKMPKAGVELRTDAFVTITDTNKTFHLDDLSVRGYNRAFGTAGVFNFFVMTYVTEGDVSYVTVGRDASGRELRFYWYDVPQNSQANLVRAPGWYDADGLNRWENLEFQPGQAFAVQGNGLEFETFGLVLDTEMRVKVPANTYVAVGQSWAKHANLCDIRMENDGAHDIGGGVVLQTLNADLTREKAYYWYSVTNGIASADLRYREPGWYAGVSKSSRYDRESGVAFDMGRAFWVQGYQANAGEPGVECEYVLPRLQLFMKDYEPWSEQ